MRMPVWRRLLRFARNDAAELCLQPWPQLGDDWHVLQRRHRRDELVGALRPDAAEELDKLAVLLKQHPILRIEIAGYTDSRASSDYNTGLSRRRAEAAKDYLVSKGIAAGRLTVKWYGKTHLANQCTDGVNCTEADHQLNRRVEFKVLNN